MSEHRPKSPIEEEEPLELDDTHDAAEAVPESGAAEREVGDADGAEAGKRETGPGELEAEHRELSDRYLRLAAEFDNFRKRTARDWTERVQSANAEVLFELLSIADNFERALEVDHADGAYADGVRMIFHQLRSLLERRGVEAIETVGLPFDPHIHEALMHTSSDEYAEGRVCMEIRKGYRLHGRVLRPAQVAVSSGPSQRSEDSADP